MKAIILAAGIGSRLRPMTADRPKCLVKVAGKPILDHQIDAFTAAGIRDIIIITGYEASKIRKRCKHRKNVRITLVDNRDFSSTNNMYSLYLSAKKVRGEPFLLSNGDVVFDPTIVKDLLDAEASSAIAVEQGAYVEESMKITVNSKGMANAISKKIPAEEAYGVSIDLYKFSAEASETLFRCIVETVEERENLNAWTEVAIHELIHSGVLKMAPFDIDGRPWVEIDNHDDLILAQRRFAKYRPGQEKLVFFDLDGTLYLSDRLIEGTKELLEKMRKKGVSYYFLSNNSSRSKSDYVHKLGQLGIVASEGQIILSTDGLVAFLKENEVQDVFLVGTRSMEEALTAAGINTRSTNPEYVVLGYDTEINYEKIRIATLHLVNGVDLLATHCDLVCPTPEGPVPDIGSVLAMFKAATGVKPDRVFGKPNVEMVEHVIAREGVPLDQVVIVGDRLYTDMEMARRLKCRGVLVLSGDTHHNDLQACTQCPDLVVRSVAEL